MEYLEKYNEKLIKYILEKSNTLTYNNYESGEVIVNIGDLITKFGIIISGTLEIVNYTYHGEKKSHQYLEKDNTIPIYPIYYHSSGKREYKYTLKCETDAEIAWIDKDEFLEIIKKDPEILYDMLMHISIRGYKSQLQLRCMNYNKVRERLAYWIVEMNDIEDKGYIKLPRTQTILADSLYVNRSSLNQELNKLVDEKLIEINNRILKILDIEKLKENF